MGDAHGGALARALFTLASEAGANVEVVALGGAQLQQAGATLLGDNTGLSSIGLLEALPFVMPSLRIQAQARAHLRSHPPDVVVLIDYPGVNIPFGRFLKKTFGCPIVYYIPPNEWLFSSARTRAIVEMSDRILAVYSGEAEYYARAGGRVQRVGHPLLDAVTPRPSKNRARAQLGVPEGCPLVALLPASRRQELTHVWPIIARAAALLKQRQADVRFVVPVASEDFVGALEEGLRSHGLSNCALLWKGESRVAMAAADVAITKSGSATVELALLQVPQVVVYKLDAATAWIARHLLRFNLPFVSLVNLVVDQQVVPEFVQEEANPENIADAAWPYLQQSSAASESMREKYSLVEESLGSPGGSIEAAQFILKSIGVL